MEWPRGGELAADDCWLDGYQEDSDARPSYCNFVGEVAPEVVWGDSVEEYLLGDPFVEYTFGVAVGVSRGVI